MDFLRTSSLLASFLAGIAALFAPCCITVLLPSYLTSIFRQRTTVFLMTFVFFLGLLTVFLPIGLSFGLVGRLISAWHDPIFIGGGIFLALLGFSLLLGFHFSLPWAVNPHLRGTNPFSVYILGIFSGLATTCCAPVLAGVLALSVLPGSVFWAGTYTLSYVLGMTLPLFLLAVILDKINLNHKLGSFHNLVRYRLFGREVALSLSEVLSGSIFCFMGLLIIYLTLTGNLTAHAAYQLTINLWVAQLTTFLARYLGFLPEFVWAALALVGLALLVKTFQRKLRGDSDKL